jgi:hypothetical protein
MIAVNYIWKHLVFAYLKRERYYISSQHCQQSSVDICVVHLQDKVTPSTKALWPVASFQNRSLSVALCFGYAKTLFWRRRHCGLARHFKPDPTKTVALCFGYAKTLFWRADAWWQSRWTGQVSSGAPFQNRDYWYKAAIMCSFLCLFHQILCNSHLFQIWWKTYFFFAIMWFIDVDGLASEVAGRHTYFTILKRAWSANFKMVWYVFLRPLRPELDGHDLA